MNQYSGSNSGLSHHDGEPAAARPEDSLPPESRRANRQRAAMPAEMRWQARGLVAVNNIAHAVVSSRGLAEILAAAEAEIEECLGVSSARVFLLDSDSGRLVSYQLGAKQHPLPACEENPGRADAVCRAIESGHSVRLDEDARAPSPARPGLCVPLLASQRIVGAIQVADKRQLQAADKVASFDEQDQDMLEDVAAFVAMAVENARLHESTRTEAAEQIFQETVVTLAHHVNNPLQGMVGAAELLKEHLQRRPGPEGEAPSGERHALDLLEVIISNAQEISAVLRLLQSVSLPESTTYLGSQQMLDIEGKLQAMLEATNP
jgi:GAF domain-containing protein